MILYLEYIIQDILLHAHERTYSPNDSPLAYGQRFRVTVRCIKVLTLVLQHYRVNALPDDALQRGEFHFRKACLFNVISVIFLQIPPFCSRLARVPRPLLRT